MPGRRSAPRPCRRARRRSTCHLHFQPVNPGSRSQRARRSPRAQERLWELRALPATGSRSDHRSGARHPDAASVCRRRAVGAHCGGYALRTGRRAPSFAFTSSNSVSHVASRFFSASVSEMQRMQAKQLRARRTDGSMRVAAGQRRRRQPATLRGATHMPILASATAGGNFEWRRGQAAWSEQEVRVAYGRRQLQQAPGSRSCSRLPARQP